MKKLIIRPPKTLEVNYTDGLKVTWKISEINGLEKNLKKIIDMAQKGKIILYDISLKRYSNKLKNNKKTK